ncbi:hypothetical protein KM043_016902 [Ampulex compressa]|nr:hypothetical protein KM043_016902 [Ampulex compressa]
MVNRSTDKIPLELFTGQKPDLSHIRIFGIKVFILSPKENRKKFHNKAEEGVLIGYHGDTAGYQILNPVTNRVWISRSVLIIETKPKRQESSSQTKKREALLAPTAEIKPPAAPTTQ